MGETLNNWPAPTGQPVEGLPSPDQQLQANGIISSVPGFEHTETTPSVPASVTPEVGSRENPVVVDTAFKGDPRRVIGHPSNPMTNMSQAYGDHLRNNQA